MLSTLEIPASLSRKILFSFNSNKSKKHENLSTDNVVDMEVIVSETTDPIGPEGFAHYTTTT